MSGVIIEMQSDNFSTANFSSTDFSPAAAQILPMELVLRILDSLALENRDSHPAYAHSLSHVSRAVRTSVMPILYEVLVLNIRSSTGTIIGWDGRIFDHPAIAFLSWLLGDPSALPRRHVKHLVFNHSYAFSGSEIALPHRQSDDNRKRSPAAPNPDHDSAPLWVLDSIIATFPSDIVSLRNAGIHARAVHWLAVMTPSIRPDPLSSTALNIAARLYSVDPFAQSRVRFHTQPIHAVLSDRETDALWSTVVRYQEIDPAFNIGGPTKRQSVHGVRVFIDIDLEDGFAEIAGPLVNEIAAILDANPRTVKRVVLVCARDASHNVVRDLAGKLFVLLPVYLHEHVWIARSSWPDRNFQNSDLLTTLGRLIQLGIDPWESGKCLAHIEQSNTDYPE